MTRRHPDPDSALDLLLDLPEFAAYLPQARPGGSCRMGVAPQRQRRLGKTRVCSAPGPERRWRVLSLLLVAAILGRATTAPHDPVDDPPLRAPVIDG